MGRGLREPSAVVFCSYRSVAYPTMKSLLVMVVSGLLAFSGCDEGPKPLKEGVIWSVRWVQSSTPTTTVTDGLYRTDKKQAANSNR